MTAAAFEATVLTIFPDLFPGTLGASLLGRALVNGLWRLDAHDLRAHALDRHASVDDAPFGGGAGMVMRPDVVARAVDAAFPPDDPRPRVCLSPRGRRFDQRQAAAWAEGQGLVLLCGRYEGIDQRVIEARGFEEVSVGDFVLTGGEAAAMLVLDATLRLIPGVLGAPESLLDESFAAGGEGLLEYPHYTRPQVWEGRAVPEVLLSGHHARVEAWRRAESLRLTRARRPDLLPRYPDAGARPAEVPQEPQERGQSHERHPAA
ncbi:MAG: tRNA (guanosine(37)-N1)-methyltransferase TrmD [Geminicoccaceae bacterium]|nr:tRNA (guanosine(37)-N1)-methyltransferase TrmD [Geminicoccaceae bacterium]